MGFREEIEKSFREIRNVKCDIKTLQKEISNLAGNNGILSIDSLNIDNDGKLIITFTDVNGSQTLETTSLQKFIIKFNVQNYNELLNTTPNLYEYGYVREPQGTQWLPGNVGGTYYPAGLYMWDGIKWIKDDMTLINEVNNIINTMNTWEQTQW